MDVKYLNYILAIANRHNMTKAAEDLFVSQSSLSQYLSRLEQELGTPLFTRSKNELSLTPAGELYVDTARRVVQMQKELYQNIAALSHKGKISVGVTSNFGLRMLSEIIPKFKEQFPSVSIEITETSLPGLKKLLTDGGIHVGISAETSTSPKPPLPLTAVRLRSSEKNQFSLLFRPLILMPKITNRELPLLFQSWSATSPRKISCCLKRELPCAFSQIRCLTPAILRPAPSARQTASPPPGL